MRDKIKNIIAQTLGLETSDIEEGSSLREDLNLEAVQITDILEALKKELNIEVPIIDVRETETVGDFIDLVEDNTR